VSTLRALVAHAGIEGETGDILPPTSWLPFWNGQAAYTRPIYSITPCQGGDSLPCPTKDLYLP